MATLMSLAQKNVLVLKSDASLAQTARAMEARGVGSALVSDGKGHIVGLVTDRDIVCKGVAHGVSRSANVSDVMAQKLVFISDDNGIDDAVAAMKKHGIRRLPVIRTNTAGKNRCVGLLSLDDLVLAKAISVQDLAEVLKKQLRRSVKSMAKKSRKEMEAARKKQILLASQQVPLSTIM